MVFFFFLAKRAVPVIFDAVRKSRISRLAAGVVLLTVLFTQVGLNLLHSHHGLPSHHQIALSAFSESSPSACKACALDGVLTLFVETSEFILPAKEQSTFVAPAISNAVLSFSGRSVGRAPPVC